MVIPLVTYVSKSSQLKSCFTFYVDAGRDLFAYTDQTVDHKTKTFWGKVRKLEIRYDEKWSPRTLYYTLASGKEYPAVPERHQERYYTKLQEMAKIVDIPFSDNSLDIREITFDKRQYFRIGMYFRGNRITGVKDGSVANENEVLAGMIISKVNGQDTAGHPTKKVKAMILEDPVVKIHFVPPDNPEELAYDSEYRTGDPVEILLENRGFTPAKVTRVQPRPDGEQGFVYDVDYKEIVSGVTAGCLRKRVRPPKIPVTEQDTDNTVGFV